MHRLVLCVALLIAALAPPRLVAAESAGGRVLMTVVGAITQTNRGPFDSFRDALLGKYVEGFDKAHGFDQAALDTLPQASTTLSYGNWDGQPHVFSGPPLAAVLEAAGATGTKVSVMAVDGYFADFGMDVVQESSMILATRMDGQLLPVGGFGPTWLVFEPGMVPGLAGDKDDSLVWAVILITVQ